MPRDTPLSTFLMQSHIHPISMSQSPNKSHKPLETPSLHKTQTFDTNTHMDTASTYSEHAGLLSKKDLNSGFSASEHNDLSRGLQIPSKSSHLTSGFEYPAVLAQYNISEQDWTQFTREITQHAKLTSAQWRNVVGAGIGTMAIGLIIIGFMGAVPAAMVARRKRANQESRNLAAAMGPSSPEPETNEDDEQQGTPLFHRIKFWNETFFEPRGLFLRIDMPYDDSALEDKLDVASKSRSSPRTSRPSSVSSTDNDDGHKARYKARERCRIVIVPLTGRAESMMSQATTLAGESPYVSAVYE